MLLEPGDFIIRNAVFDVPETAFDHPTHRDLRTAYNEYYLPTTKACLLYDLVWCVLNHSLLFQPTALLRQKNSPFFRTITRGIKVFVWSIL